MSCLHALSRSRHDQPGVRSGSFFCCIFTKRKCTMMGFCYRIACLLLLSLAALGQSKPSMVPQTVEFASGKLHLMAYFWKPAGSGPFPAVLFNHGSGGADSDHTAG